MIAKPDQLIKRRGKLGLIKINATLEEVKVWIKEKMSQEIEVTILYRSMFNRLLVLNYEIANKLFINVLSLSKHKYNCSVRQLFVQDLMLMHGQYFTDRKVYRHSEKLYHRAISPSSTGRPVIRLIDN